MLFDKNTFLIIGGTGFLGHALAKKLIIGGNKVFSFSKKNPKKKRKIDKVIYLKGNIKKLSGLRKVLKKNKFDYVINCGGYVEHINKKEIKESHYKGSRNLYDYFKDKDLKSFIHIGSSSEYGDTRVPHREGSKCKPKGLYGKFKLKTTKFFIKRFEDNKFPVTILRFYQVYGPYQDFNRFIPQLIKSSLMKKKFITTEGKQFRDFLFIDDAIDAIIKALITKKSVGQIINVGLGKGIQLRKIMNLIKRKNRYLKPDFGKIKLRPEEKIFVFPNIDKARKILKWSPKFSINKGLEITNKYFKKNLI